MRKKLYLSRTDKKLAGVCGGIGDFLDIDPTLVRIAMVFLVVACGMGLMAYLVIWAVTPREQKQ